MSTLIAVGVDDTSSSQAVRWAIEWATNVRAPIEFVHSLPAPSWPSSEPDTTRRQHGAQVVNRAAQAAGEAGLVDVRTSVEDRAVAGALVAASERAGLLVIGRRPSVTVVGGRSASVSRHLSRYSHCPVVVVPDAPPPVPTQRIILVLNGDPGDRAAIDFAFEQAAGTGAEIQAVHAWWDPGPEVFSPLLDDDTTDRFRASDVLMAEELAGRQDAYPGVRVIRSSIVGAPDRAVLSAAEHADLIVLPAAAPTDDMLRSGEPERVALRHATCPVVYAR